MAMDAALWELLEEGESEDEIAAIIRLGKPGVAPPNVRLVAEFGNIATCRLKRADIVSTREAEEVASFKAARTFGPEPEIEEQLPDDFSEAHTFVDERRPDREVATGRGCVIGVVDWGCDFAHPDFRNPDGSTRLLVLWDQRPDPTRTPPSRYGYGVVHTREAINEALRTSDPYAALGYHPADADIGQGSHGTHVLGIAAGNGRAGGPQGVAPEADIVFVHSATLAQENSDRLGDSVTLLEAIDFINNVAANRPWVINLSMGKHGEQHDGTTLVEQGFDQILSAAPGRAIVQSTGNYFQRRIHSSGQLRPSERRELTWEVQEVDPTPNQLEIWYPGPDTFGIEVIGPREEVRQTAALDQQAAITFAGKEIGKIYHRRAEPNNLSNHIEIFLYRGAPAGSWTIALTAVDVVDGRYHAWIERDAACPHCQSQFSEHDAVCTSTTGTICNGFRTIAVGAYNLHSDGHELAPFSSSGPTRDGRIKPDLVAPGVRVLAARSAPREAREDTSLLTRMSGTSMASPYVAGTVALMFAAAKRPLRIEETHNLLLSSTRKPMPHTEDKDIPRIGSGYCEISKAVTAARSIANPALSGGPLQFSKEIEMELKHESKPLETAARIDGTGRRQREARFELSEPAAVEIAEANEAAHKEFHECGCHKAEGTASVSANASGSFETQLVAKADEVISTQRGPISHRSLLTETLARTTAGDPSSRLQKTPYLSPGTIFETFVRSRDDHARQQLESLFEVVAFPRTPVRQTKPGDILLRRAEGGFTHMAMLASGETFKANELASAGLRPESSGPGYYAKVIEAGPFPHSDRDQYARRISDTANRVPPDSLLLRLSPRNESIHETETTPLAEDVSVEIAEAVCPVTEDIGLAEQPAPPAPAIPLAAPDSAAAGSFVPAHASRYCTPGQAGSGTCQALPTPRPIRRVVIHALAVPSTSTRSGVQAVVAGWQNSGRQASSHYLVDRNGDVTQMVREANVAFHTPGNNTDSIGIEHADVCNDPAPLTTQLYESSAALVRDLSSRHGFPINNTTVAGHSQVNPNHGDPGPYWDWEYYFLLLGWDGIDSQSRPLRVVSSANSQSAVPAGWQSQNRRAIANDHCAHAGDPWGATYWRAQPNATAGPAEISLIVNEAGVFKISLWWPDIVGANSAVPVDIEVACLSSPCTGASVQSVTINQRSNAGRWSDVASVTVTQAPSEIKVRIRRDSSQSGWILADGLRVLKIASPAGGPSQSGQSVEEDFVEQTTPPVIPPPRQTTVTHTGFRPDVTVLCPPPPVILDNFDFDEDRLKPAHQTQIDTLAQTIFDSQSTADPVHTLCVLGHTDSAGPETHNRDLGARRAIAIANRLEAAIDARQAGLSATLGLTIESRGEEAPLVPNTSAANRARNRRVEIFVNQRWVSSGPAVGACPTIAVASDDPTTPTPFAVGEDDFSATVALTIQGSSISIPVSGSVFYPAVAAGAAADFATNITTPVPLVVLAHGNHETFRSATDRFNARCGAASGFIPLENHRGYEYLQRLLAGAGMVVASVNANITNCQGQSTTNINVRAALILATIQHFLNLHSSGASRFLGKIDFSRIGLLGHSRGGEAVLAAAETFPTIASLSAGRVLGIVSVAPTDTKDLNTGGQATSGKPSGFAFMAVLPAADGDVSDNDGAKFYDQATPSPFKCQLYVHGANHNFFNRNWAFDEGHGGARLSRADHERILSVYGCAFFRAVLLAENTLRFLRRDVLPPATLTDAVQISFEASGAITVDDHENRNISINALGAPTTQSAGLTAAEFDFQQGVISSFNNTFFGKTVGMVAQTSAAGGLFRSQLSANTNLTGREVWVRAAEVYNGSAVPSQGTGYQIGVEDATGNVSFADSNDVGGLPRPFDRRADDLARVGIDLTKTMLKTNRYTAACFVRSGLDLTQIRALLLKLDRGDNRALAFDQLQIV
jgi:outer membrane protein OmpA-like peptidoglycan-associated protein/dienelactone hydrolase